MPSAALDAAGLRFGAVHADNRHALVEAHDAKRQRVERAVVEIIERYINLHDR